jgi:hypothetical protein
MNVLHGRLEALEKVGAGALADQALLKLVRLHLQKYEKHLAEGRKSWSPLSNSSVSALRNTINASWGKK